MTAIRTTYTTDVETSTRNGVALSVTDDTSTQSVGNFVTDVSMQPYMASEIISFYAYNMRPNQRLHAFFDSINVDQYVRQGIVPTGSFNTATSDTIRVTSGWGSAGLPLVADSHGRVAGQFAIPSGTFKTGDRVFQLADTDNLVLGADALTTKAAATFTASNMSVTKETVTLTTVNPVISVIPVTQTTVNTTYSNTTVNVPDVVNIDAQYEPIAQGLTINTPSGEAGVYATSLDLYFKQTSMLGNHGVTVYLCEIENGYPNGKKILPFSTVHLDSGSLLSSLDASVKTTFTFEAPVFLNNGLEYAFIVKPDNNDPDIWVYSANLGDISINANNVQVYSQPVQGTAFYGATMNEWTALQTEYIMFNLNIAIFSSAQGDVYFNNANTDYLTLQNIALTTNNTILPGDIVYQSTNSTVSTVNTSITGTLRAYDSTRNILYVENSTANFTSNSYLQVHRFGNTTLQTSPGPNTTTQVAFGNTGIMYNPIVDGIVGQFATLIPAGTSVNFDYKGMSNTYLIDSTVNAITPGTETDMFDHERMVASVSNEVLNGSSNKSLTMHSRMQSDSALLSPMIDLVKANDLVIANLVDPVSFIYNEYYNNGSSKTKYISQPITLAAGQDSQDLQIHITAHRPPGTDIVVYAKFLSAEDTDSITSKTWTPMVNLGYNTYSDPTNPNDFSEFIYQTFPYYGLTPTTGTITANSVLANTVTGVNTLFGTDVQIGWWINMAANNTYSEVSRQVVSIQSNTSLILNAPFNANYTNSVYYVVPPLTTAWQAATSSTLLSGNVTVNTASNQIIGNGTTFTTLLPGQIISINNDEQAITSISNSTVLSVGTPWSSNATGANAYLVSMGGLTYLNNKSALFTNYNRFQLKVILQSNNSATVPLLDDIRALAMQL